jgi:hypothetical protein
MFLILEWSCQNHRESQLKRSQSLTVCAKSPSLATLSGFRILSPLTQVLAAGWWARETAPENHVTAIGRANLIGQGTGAIRR